MPRTTLTTLVLVLGLVLITGTTHGGEIGHYAPGLPNIRDFVVPEPGFYGVLYNYFQIPLNLVVRRLRRVSIAA